MLRHLAPYLHIRSGTTLQTAAIPANTVLPQPCPKAEYNGGAAIGMMAPPTDLAIVTAASAEAENVSKLSIMYVVMDSWTVVIPTPATPLPMIGMIHDVR